MSGGLHLALGAIAGALLFACSLWSATAIAARITGEDAPTSVRASAAVVVCIWLLVAAFHVLAALSLFRLWAALPLWIAVTAALHGSLRRGPSLRQRAREDWARARASAVALRGSWVAWLGIVGAALMGVRLLRGLVAPPLAWDALTYRLLKAGRWVQAGGLVHEAAPDAWNCYEHYPYTGEILWAWAMLPVHGDALIAPAGFLVWFAVVLGAYTAARGLGAGTQRALLAALVVGFTPAVANFVTTAYVDNLVLALFLLGAVFVQRALEPGREKEALLAAAALGLAAGVKITAAPLVPIAFAVLAVGLRKLRWRAVAVLAGCGAAAAIGLPPYLRTWWLTGSPFFPIPVDVAGRELFAGHPVFSLLVGADLFDAARFPRTSFIDALFSPGALAPQLGLGPIAPLVILAGLAGAWSLRRSRLRPIAAFLLAAAIAVVASLLSPDAVALRTKWASSSVRFLTPAFAALTLLGCCLPARVLDWVWTAHVVVGMALQLPLGWSPQDVRLVAELLGMALTGLAAIVGAVWWQRRRPRPLLPVVVAIGVIVAVSFRLAELRHAHRYASYAAAAVGRAFDAHPILWAQSWPIWKALDAARPFRIAVTAGWNGAGDNWLRYPLLGSRLQNNVLYVPPTRDGSVLDLSLERDAASRMDFEAWLARLRQQQIDVVVALVPLPLEAAWLEAHPELFVPIASGAGGISRAYRLRKGSVSKEAIR